MDLNIEQNFIKLFCIPRKRERLHFELSSTRKRRAALGRFSHQFKNILIEKYMIELPKPNSDAEEIFKLMKSYGANEKGYCLSFNPEIDGKTLPLLEGLQKAVGCGLPSIILCGERLCYFESEQEVGPPKRFVLKRE